MFIGVKIEQVGYLDHQAANFMLFHNDGEFDVGRQ